MSLLYLPARLSALFLALALGLHPQIARRFPRLLLGVLFARGRRTVTSWFRAVGITQEYKQAYRDVAAAGRSHEHSATAVLAAVERLLQPQDDLLVALDDTPTPRWGPWVEGAGIHHNPNPGPAGEKYLYGHVWVTLAALLDHPEQGVRALPLRAELYVRLKDITATLRRQGIAFATRLQQAAQQLLWLSDAADRGRRIRVVADGAYAKRPLLVVLRRLQLTLVSRLPKNAALWTLPSCKRRKGQRGPLPTYGKQRIDLARRAQNPRGWHEVSCVQYRQRQTKRIKTFVATWRPACGAIRVVLVMEEEGCARLLQHGPEPECGKDLGVGGGSRCSGRDVQGRQGSMGSGAATGAERVGQCGRVQHERLDVQCGRTLGVGAFPQEVGGPKGQSMGRGGSSALARGQASGVTARNPAWGNPRGVGGRAR